MVILVDFEEADIGVRDDNFRVTKKLWYFSFNVTKGTTHA